MTIDHLREIQSLALDELASTFTDYDAKYAPYQDRLLAICLCGDAAVHYSDPTHGLTSIEIWMFFRGFPPGKAFSSMHRDFLTTLHRSFAGLGEMDVNFHRKVVPLEYQEVDILETLHRYFTECKNATPAALSQKPVVGLFRDSIFGQVIWSVGSDARPRS